MMNSNLLFCLLSRKSRLLCIVIALLHVMVAVCASTLVCLVSSDTSVLVLRFYISGQQTRFYSAISAFLIRKGGLIDGLAGNACFLFRLLEYS